MTYSFSSSFPTLISLQRRWIRFLDWWLGELTGLIPAPIRLWWRGASRDVLLSIDNNRVTFSRPTENGLVEILSVSIIDDSVPLLSTAAQQKLRKTVGGDYQLLFVAPVTQVLQRMLTLPAVLAENLRQTLVFELDRYTPFRPDQAYFDYRVVNQGNVSGHLLIDLAVIPRSVADAYMARLSAVGLKIGGIVLAADFARPNNTYRNILPTGSIAQSSSGGLKQRIACTALRTLFVVLLAILIIIPIWQKRSAAISLIAPVAQAKAVAKEADALRNQLDKLVADHDLLPNKKWDSYSMSLVLEELTKLLPDDTFVMQFDFDGKSVQLIGETASAASMLETIEGSSLFKDVAFRSPLTKIQGSPFDRFQIGTALEATVRPAPVPAISEEQEGTISTVPDITGTAIRIEPGGILTKGVP
jgi:general secretion pathway protein L